MCISSLWRPVGTIPVHFPFLVWGFSPTFAAHQFGWWRSPVAHLYGVQGVAGSNPVHPTVSAEASAQADFFLSLVEGGFFYI